TALGHAQATSFSQDPGGLLVLVFPFLYGNARAEGPVPAPYAGEWTLTELGGYVGVAALVLAAAGLPAVRRDRRLLALLLVAAGSVLTVTALLLDLGTAANVLSLLHADAAGGALYTTLVAAVAPNVALMGGAYLLGPGFAVGTGTIVSPATVLLGPVPAFPLLAALPESGPGPVWATALVGVPVLIAALAAGLTARRHPAVGYETAALRSLGVGVLGGLLCALLVLLAGGSIGPGRMSEVGAPNLDTLVAAPVAMGVGALVGGLATTWWLRRKGQGSDAGEPTRRPDTEDTEDTVIL
ncbi:MAG: hypothetical protein H0V42_11380, partial [Nocardioidaceae bacterium]|nr:hypothetical protein [Nocardioidaceae bacterium]